MDSVKQHRKFARLYMEQQKRDALKQKEDPVNKKPVEYKRRLAWNEMLVISKDNRLYSLF